MSYRKLVIDDRTYEYSIGKSHTKIRGGSVFENSKIGNPVVNGDGIEIGEYVVTPLNVKHAILGLPIPIFTTSDGTTTKLMLNPYDYEILNKTVYIPYNRELYNSLADDI